VRATRFLATLTTSRGEVGPDLAADAEPDEIIRKPDELTWWDWTVFLLQTAAEIEHALMVQYLYAAYSLADGGFTGPDAAEKAALTDTWRTTIIGIAREEMAHLLTEQNLLLFLGGPLNVEREDFPFRSALYPFPLHLRPLTRDSLATYVAAEMPAAPDVPDINTIVARATNTEGGFHPNRVGRLFATLLAIFDDHENLPDSDFRPHTADQQQANENDWSQFFPGLIIRKIGNRDDAKNALKAIGEQGEGPQQPAPGEPASHFERFLEIYHAFPEATEWVPTRPVPTDPTTGPDPDPDQVVELNRITHPGTRLWGQLGNVRYRMLLADLVHALLLNGPYADASGPTPRGHLLAWTFEQMRGRPGPSGLRGIAKLLTTRPVKEDPVPGAPTVAGMPFEPPYTFALPDDEHGRWRVHLALLDSSAKLVAALRSKGESGALLDEIDATDADARAVVEAQLALP
jgi:Ferritin-like